MVEWKEIKFKQLVAEMGDGGTPDTTDPENFGKGIPWAVVEDVKPEIYETQQQLTERGFASCNAKKWPIGSIILTTGATIGNVGIAKIELCTKQGITGIVPNEHADNLFLRYWLENNTNQLLRYAQGTTFKEIRTRPLGNLRIKVPAPFTGESVKIQKKISSILYSLDRGIGQTEEVISKTERLKKALMQNLLTGKMKPDGTIRKKSEFYNDRRFGNVPKGWQVSFIGDGNVAVVDPSYKFEKGQEYPFVAMEDVSDNFQGILKYETRVVESEGYSRFKNGDIIFSKITPCAENGKIALVNTLNGEIGFGSTEFIIISPKEAINKYFLFYSMISNEIHGKAISLMEGTTGRQRVPSKIFKNKLTVFYPKDINEQNEIVEKLICLEALKRDKYKNISSLQKLKKSLMQNLLTGKVGVKI